MKERYADQITKKILRVLHTLPHRYTNQDGARWTENTIEYAVWSVLKEVEIPDE